MTGSLRQVQGFNAGILRGIPSPRAAREGIWRGNVPEIGGFGHRIRPVRIESNISAVINRTQRLRDQDIPAAMKRTLMPADAQKLWPGRPAGWLEPAYEEAKATLEAIAKPDEQEYIPGFLNTLKAVAIAARRQVRRLKAEAENQSLPRARDGDPGRRRGWWRNLSCRSEPGPVASWPPATVPPAQICWWTCDS